MSLYILIWYRIMEGGYPKSCKPLKPIVLWAILCHKSEYHHVIHWVSQLACCGTIWAVKMTIKVVGAVVIINIW